jgi:3-hydroxyacyl-[acyl-carrier-protein] dehydratase
MIALDRAAIEALLPHRAPFLFLDRVESLEPGVRAVGWREVPRDEFWVGAHFPGTPVLPGVLLAEALAQLAAVLAISAQPEFGGRPVYLVGFDKLRFRRPVRPGDAVRLEVSVVEAGRLWAFDGLAMVNGEKVADGRFLASAGVLR